MVDVSKGNCYGINIIVVVVMYVIVFGGKGFCVVVFVD